MSPIHGLGPGLSSLLQLGLAYFVPHSYPDTVGHIFRWMS